MWKGNGSESIKPFPSRAAYVSCVCMCVPHPAMIGDAVIILLAYRSLVMSFSFLFDYNGKGLV